MGVLMLKECLEKFFSKYFFGFIFIKAYALNTHWTWRKQTGMAVTHQWLQYIRQTHIGIDVACISYFILSCLSSMRNCLLKTWISAFLKICFCYFEYTTVDGGVRRLKSIWNIFRDIRSATLSNMETILNDFQTKFWRRQSSFFLWELKVVFSFTYQGTVKQP